MKLLCLTLLFSVSLSGCATLKNKTLVYGAIGFVGCSVAGVANAPKDESQAMHAMAFGSACAAGVMAVKEIHESISNKKSKERINQLRSSDVVLESSIRKSLIESDSYDSLDDSIKKSLNGKWKIYKTDNWLYDGQKMVREDVHVEFENEKK